jgi:hypothetical protein
MKVRLLRPARARLTVCRPSRVTIPTDLRCGPIKTPDPSFADHAASADSRRRATIAYVAPFLAFVGIMAVERLIPLPPQWLYPVRFLIVTALIGALSWPYLSFRPSAPLASIAIGVAVFVIWVAPDLLFGYRHHWLFENSLTGAAASSLAPHLKANIGFMLLRSFSSAILIPILEELFWRGWMMRWLIMIQLTGAESATAPESFLKTPTGWSRPTSAPASWAPTAPASRPC